MRKHYLLILIGTFFLLPIFSQQQSERYKPAWMNGDMPPKSNHSYEFRVMTGEGKTLHEARYNATMTLFNDLMREKGVSVSSVQREKVLARESIEGYSETSIHDYNYTFEYDKHKFSFKAVDEYWEQRRGIYHCFMLYEVALMPDKVHFDAIEYTTSYGSSALFRSLVVPGWGQMYKRQRAKGIAVLACAVVGAGGVVVSQNQYTSYRNKAKEEFNTDVRKTYQNKSTSWGNVRNGFIVGAAAVYVYNIIDVLASKGAKRYKKKDLSFFPFVGTSESYGITMALII